VGVGALEKSVTRKDRGDGCRYDHTERGKGNASHSHGGDGKNIFSRLDDKRKKLEGLDKNVEIRRGATNTIGSRPVTLNAGTDVWDITSFNV